MLKHLPLICLIGILYSFTPKKKEHSLLIFDNENLTYIASYSISGTMTDVAEVTLSSKKVTTKSNKTFHKLTCKATTYESWDSYFKVRDLFESYVNPQTLKPVLFKRNVAEGNYRKKTKYKFNWKDKKVNASITKGDNTLEKSLTIYNRTNDLVSSIYYIRGIDFNGFQPNQKQQFSVLVDGKMVYLDIEYVKLTQLKVKNQYKKAHKLQIHVKSKGYEKAQGQKLIYLSADEQKIPLLITANLPVGDIKLRLK